MNSSSRGKKRSVTPLSIGDRGAREPGNFRA
jgi:hypothetical protein